MSRLTLPVLVRQLLCAALFGVLSASTALPGQAANESASMPGSHLPTTDSLSGYIIAVG